MSINPGQLPAYKWADKTQRRLNAAGDRLNGPDQGTIDKYAASVKKARHRDTPKNQRPVVTLTCTRHLTPNGILAYDIDSDPDLPALPPVPTTLDGLLLDAKSTSGRGRHVLLWAAKPPQEWTGTYSDAHHNAAHNSGLADWADQHNAKWDDRKDINGILYITADPQLHYNPHVEPLQDVWTWTLETPDPTEPHDSKNPEGWDRTAVRAYLHKHGYEPYDEATDIKAGCPHCHNIDGDAGTDRLHLNRDGILGCRGCDRRDGNSRALNIHMRRALGGNAGAEHGNKGGRPRATDIYTDDGEGLLTWLDENGIEIGYNADTDQPLVKAKTGVPIVRGKETSKTPRAEGVTDVSMPRTMGTPQEAKTALDNLHSALPPTGWNFYTKRLQNVTREAISKTARKTIGDPDNSKYAPWRLSQHRWQEAVDAAASYQPVDVLQDWFNDIRQLTPTGHDPATTLAGWYNQPADSALAWAYRAVMGGWLHRHHTPGTKMRRIPIFVGGPSLGKTTLLEELAPTISDTGYVSFRCDGEADGARRDLAVALAQATIANADELAGLRRDRLDGAKEALTASKDTFIRKYVGEATHQPRRCVITGTCNYEKRVPYDPALMERLVLVEVPGRAVAPIEHLLTRDVHRQLWRDAIDHYDRQAEGWLPEPWGWEPTAQHDARSKNLMRAQMTRADRDLYDADQVAGISRASEPADAEPQPPPGPPAAAPPVCPYGAGECDGPAPDTWNTGTHCDACSRIVRSAQEGI